MNDLLQNYQKIAWRNLIRSPFLSALNFVGLLLGTVTSLLIFGYVVYESAFDTFQSQYQQLYRVVSQHYEEGALQRETAFTVPALGPTVAELVPGVEAYIRLTAWAQSYTLAYQPGGEEPVIYKEQQAYFADATIIPHFGLHLLQGDPETALTEPGEMMLSASAAVRYFGPEWRRRSLVGQRLDYHDANHGTLTFTIAGIFEDYPEQSHLQFDMLFSHASLPLFLPEEIPPKQRAEMFDVSWGPPTWYTYVQLDGQAEPGQVAQLMTEEVENRSSSPEHREILRLQPVEEIHLHSDLQDEPRLPGSATRIYLLTGIGIVILVIAWMNYVNLVVVKALSRAKEVGLRKVFSATRPQLLLQFMSEAFLINLAVLLAAVGVVALLFPLFSGYLNLPAQLSLLNTPILGLLLLGLVAAGTFATGLYPAFLLTNYSPLVALKNHFAPQQKGRFRSAVVIFQLGGALLLLVVTLVTVRQVQYMRDQGAGVKIQNTLVIEAPNVMEGEGSFTDRVEALRSSLQPFTSIEEVSAADFIPGSQQLWNIQAARAETPDDLLNFKQINVDQQYLGSINAVFLAGDDFSRYPNPDGKIILNRSSAQMLGYNDPQEAIRQKLKIFHGGWTPELEIIGVVENYHQQSLANAYEPILFFPNLSNGNILVNISATDSEVASTLDQVRQAWGKIFSGNPFDYFFLQDFYQRQYRSDEQFSKAFRLGTVVAVFIALLGLIAMVAFTTLKKQREIGIRKVLGASVTSILWLLTRRVFLLVALACGPAIPLAYWLVRAWLDKYAFRIELHPLLFIIPVLGLLLLVIVTMSFHTLRAARTNPVNVLHDE